MSNAAQARQPRIARHCGQGFSLRCTHIVLRKRPFYKPQAQTRGERRSSGKGPFMDGN